MLIEPNYFHGHDENVFLLGNYEFQMMHTTYWSHKLTAIIWSPTWIRPSWSTALSFVMLLTKIPEGSEESEEVVKLKRAEFTFHNIHNVKYLNVNRR